MRAGGAGPDVTAVPLPRGTRALGRAAATLLYLAVLAALLLVVAAPGEDEGPPDPLPVLIGRLCALAAAGMVLGQFFLSARLRLLDRIFSLPALLKDHRRLAWVAVCLATLHPMLVLAPKVDKLGPLRAGLWPLYLGALLLAAAWTTVLASTWRRFLRFEYQYWWRLHRVIGLAAPPLLAAHALSVTEDFHGGWPLALLVSLLAAWAWLLAWAKLVKPARLRRRPWTVAAVTPAGPGVTAVELVPANGQAFPYLPGQFAFVRFRSRQLPPEEHHFTLSSTPTRGTSLVQTIKCAGDFTAAVHSLRPGDTAEVDGPYGLFSHLVLAAPAQPLVMIAGGIGITPMLSMLRHMGDRLDMRSVTLIWSNREEKGIFCGRELEEMKARLSNLTVRHVLTREGQDGGRRLDRERLSQLLDGVERNAAVLVCGPPGMNRDVARWLSGLGFGSRQIHTEVFGLG